MKIALITDQHFGIRNDNIAFLDYYDRFYANTFFPYLEEHGITTIMMLGDTFDRRKYTNHNTAYQARKIYFDKLAPYTVHCIVGNHDVAYKNTNEVNAPDLLLHDYKNIHIYDSPKTITIDGTDIAMLPWICSGNMKESLAFVEETPAQILFGHLELMGFEMYRGHVNDHGFDAEIFTRFDVVCSGHFHHKSTKGNVHYLGAPYEMTWSDYNDPRGFHIFDTETRELEYIQNPFRMFQKVHYDDTFPEEEIMAFDTEQFRGAYVKVIVRQKTNPVLFDTFVDKIEKNGVLDLQVVEDHFNLNLEDDSDIVENAEDTLTILRHVIEQVDSNVPKKELDKFMTSLYNEAMMVE